MHRYIEGASIGILHDYITTAKNQSSDNRISMDIPDIRMFISVEFEVFGHVQGKHWINLMLEIEYEKELK